MKKLLSILMLLVAIVTGASAATTWTFRAADIKSGASFAPKGTNVFVADDGKELTYKGNSDSDALVATAATIGGVSYSSYVNLNGATGSSRYMYVEGISGPGTLSIVFASGKDNNKKITINDNAYNGTEIASINSTEAKLNGTKQDIEITTSLNAEHKYYINGQRSVYAVIWTPSIAKDYTVTAATNNSAYGTASTSASSLDEGETATITATPKPGYKFDSWAVEGEGAELSSPTTNPTTLTIGTSDATVTATFSIATLNITHNEAENGTYTISVAGGEATDANTTATIGQTITLAGTPALPSFTAVSWNVKDANNNNVTVTDNQFTMPGSSVTISPVFSKPSVIKVTINGSSATVSGSIGGTADVYLSSAGKMDKNRYAGFTLAGENTFQEGDIINVNIKTAAGDVDGKTGTIIFYDTKTGTNALMETGVVGVVGDNKFVVNSNIVGNQTIYLYRSDDNTENPWNAVINYIEVIRADATITLNASGYATYSKATDFEFAGAKAYKMNLNYTGGTLQGTEVMGKIAAGAGILFKGEAGAKVAITETTGASALTDNSLVGTTPATGDAPTPDYNNYKYFVLKGKSFVPYTTATTFGAGKAFFQVDKNAQTPASFELVFDGEATAVEAIAEAKANTAAPVKVIKNGKLYIGNYNVAGARIK